MSRRPRLLAGACALAALTLGGCNYMAYFLYLVAPEGRAKKIDPEFDKLPGSSVAVIVYADGKTQSEHDNIQLEVSSAVSAELRKRVEDVSVVSPRRVVKYQRENLFWDEMDRTRIGKDLGATYVVYVSLDEFSTLEPGSLQLFRGRVTASASVYETALPARDARVWGPIELRVVYPAEGATGQTAESDDVIRHRTITILADQLVRKFYEHKQEPAT
jgi:hypothetical protein